MTGSPPLMIGAGDMAGDDRLLLVVDALADAFRDLRTRQAPFQPRTLLQLGPSELLVSPAAWEQRGVASVKVTTLAPDNPRRGLPLIHGIVVLTDVDTGQVMALLDGAELTAVRTGAVAGLATKLCTPPDASDLAILGAGTQARALLRAMSAVRPIRSVRLCSRTATRTEAFADWIRACTHSSVQVAVCDTPRAAIRDAEIICTATSTSDQKPLIDADWVAPGAHLNVIGGTHEDAIEVDPQLLKTAFVTVEQRTAAQEDAGEVRVALADGLIGVQDLHELGALLTGETTVDGERATLFRSVGLAIEDTAAAAAIYEATRSLPTHRRTSHGPTTGR
ncbi:ornithine cyclodeaminase family protein [Kibdelosporangium aridum]|uniref:Ornithine cyclodeaminase family protein n=1 Tax=Kibdelosporangium aridum TaxID=2030 RepID=A0A428Z0Q5_KIBAR|nr:ornithine cyclodeaminase family protein [Kibdelosporangium aridum]RSM77799.1 ornithine cyclodeaminase family protein [Kibdelosporangium aridum]